MEQRASVYDDVQLVERAAGVHQIRVGPHFHDVLPQQQVHPAQRVVEVAGPLDTQESGAVVAYLPLVEEVSHHGELLPVGAAVRVQLLVDVGLSQRDVVLEIRQVMLIQQVVHLGVHAFHNVVAHLVAWVRLHLHNALLHILVKVPGDHAVNIVLMVVGGHLEPVFVDSFEQVLNLDPRRKVYPRILQDVIPYLLQDQIQHISAGLPSLLLVWDQAPKLDVPAAEHNDEVLVVDFCVYVVGLLALELQQIFNQVLILSVIEQLLGQTGLDHSYSIDFAIELCFFILKYSLKVNLSIFWEVKDMRKALALHYFLPWNR